MKTHALEHALARAAIVVFGRRNVVRLARLLQNEARLDLPNEMGTNGELMVQRCVLDRVSPPEPVTIADIGANVGDWTLALISQVHSSNLGPVSIHAFEPEKEAAECFRSQIPAQVGDVNITLNEFGL